MQYTNGSVLTLSEVVAEIPDTDLRMDGANIKGKPGLAVTGFTVALANDGIHFSEEHLFLVYDGTCLLWDTGKNSNRFCVKKV